MPKHPLVAVTTTSETVRGVRRVRTDESYIRALIGARCVPLMLPALADAAAMERVLESVDGVLLTGGEDVDPALYGAERDPATEPSNPVRDESELALIRAAEQRRIPLLAICRGMQILNVASGGSLIQDITGCGGIHLSDGDRDARTHEIAVARATRLREALGTPRITVNSRHHQAVGSPGDGLTASAHAPDGVVEAIESTRSDWWAVGVQWHPEDLVASAESWDRELFSAFARAMTRGR